MIHESYNIEWYPDGELELLFCGYERDIPRDKSVRHIRDYFLIHYVVEGSGFYKSMNQLHRVKNSEMFVIFPGQLVNYSANPDDPWSYCWFAFTGNKARDYLAEYGIDEDNPIVPLASDNTAQSLAIQGEAEIKCRKRSKHYSSKLIYEVFAQIEQSYAIRCDAQRDNIRLNRYLETAKLYISSNLPQHLSVQTIADMIGLERTYFSKLFHRHTGMTLQDYIINMRIDMAVGLLQTGCLAIKDVAECVGIHDPYYFSKIFKKVKGVPPSKYCG